MPVCTPWESSLNRWPVGIQSWVTFFCSRIHLIVTSWTTVGAHWFASKWLIKRSTEEKVVEFYCFLMLSFQNWRNLLLVWHHCLEQLMSVNNHFQKWSMWNQHIEQDWLNIWKQFSWLDAAIPNIDDILKAKCQFHKSHWPFLLLIL